MSNDRNILGKELKSCCTNPLTGFLRDGFCRVPIGDAGMHSVCAVMTEEFLHFSKHMGNDLSTPRPEYNFPGLKPGDHWCLCASRWKEAYDQGCAPKIKLESTHEDTLLLVPQEVLLKFGV
jgi:uncharacterized protein (DUF2237 family)